MHHATSVRKLLLIWSVSLLTLCSIGYLYYSHWQQKVKPSDTLPYILSSSACVVDIPAIRKLHTDFQQTAIGQSLQALPLCNQLQESWSWLQEVAARHAMHEDFPVVMAIQGLHKDAIGCVLYLDLRLPQIAKLVERIEGHYSSQPYPQETRNYAGHAITTIHGSDNKSPKKVYLLKQSHYAIISLSELLLEDIIRGVSNKQDNRFLPLQKATSKQGNLFINFKELSGLLPIFLKEDSYATWGAQLTNILSQTQLEVKFTDHYLLLQGVASNVQPLFNDTHWLTNLPTPNNPSRTLHAYIPTSTAMVQHYAIHDPVQGVQAIAKHHATTVKPRKTADSQQQLEAASDPFEALNTCIKNEIALCTLSTEKKHQVLFIAIHDVEECIAMLQETINMQYDATHQLPSLSAVYTMDASSISHWLPQMLFPHFTPRFLSTVDNYLIVANSFEALQTLEKAYLAGNTWAKNDHTSHQLLANITEKATFSTFIDLKMAHQWILQQLKPAWELKFKKTIGEFLENGYVGLRLGTGRTPGKREGYIQVLLAQLPKKEAIPQAAIKASVGEAPTSSNVFFKTEKPIQTAPLFVETHKPESTLMLIQDAFNQLYLIKPNGKLIWKKRLDGPLIPEVLLVDMYKNKKWQYLCATPTSLYVLDYTGNEVDPFPRPILAKGKATGVNIIDYDKDKNYRILVTDEVGNIYLKDAQYRPLPGWNPNPLKTSFVAPPIHIRVTKDYFIALQDVGVLHVMNRRGQPYPGFPINIGEAVHNPPIIHQGKQAASTHIIVLTETGRLKTYTLQGTLKSNIQLTTKGTADKFTLVNSAIDKEAYVILQQSIDKLVVLNATGAVLFEKPCEADQLVIGQYYNHGSYPLYVITKVDQEKTYIYDQQGRLIHPPLPNSGYPVELFWTAPGQQLTVYTTEGNQVSKYQIDIATINFVSEDLYE